jgi:hypothetical protein
MMAGIEHDALVVQLRAELRRRRDAALRLPPLADGHRDPLDRLAGLPVPRAADWGGYDVTTLGLACSHGEDCPARKRGTA